MATITECDRRADVAVNTMVKSMVALALVPAHVNWALVATAMATGVVAIGLSYEVKLTRDEAWKLIRQFFMAAGLTFMMLQCGSKILAMILATTGIGYGGAVALDCAISAAQGYAVGMGAREHFRREFLGSQPLSQADLGRLIRESFLRKKTEMKQEAAHA
jgi:uncharacterized protein (DUF697 family)